MEVQRKRNVLTPPSGLHKIEVLLRPAHQRLVIGRVKDEQSEIEYPKPGQYSKVPYAEAPWLSPPFSSPYYNESHRRLQQEVRHFVDTELRPHVAATERDNKRPPNEVYKRMGEVNMNAMRLGPGRHLKGRKLMGGVKPEEFDYFHEMIITTELSRLPERGFVTSLNAGMIIGLPPVLNFGSEELIKEVAEPALNGDKFVALAISEAFAGSDVFGMRTYAKLSEDGSHYIVNGTKKWITNGHFADYFTTACRSDNGYSMLCIPRALGVETRPIPTSYSASAGTAFVMYNNVKVPAKYLIGQDGMGIPIVLSNFNHERWAMCCGVVGSLRAVNEVLLKWINQRKVYGRPLASQPVVRQKLAFLVAQSEASQAYLESITYQMNKMSYKEQSKYLAGPIAIMKAWMTRLSHEAADIGVQLMGGRGITKTGMGQEIENFNRTYKFDSILGGSEEVMADLGIRQALRFYPKNVRL